MKLTSLIAGNPVRGREVLEVFNPYDGSRVGTVRMATHDDLDTAVAIACEFTETPSINDKLILFFFSPLQRLRTERKMLILRYARGGSWFDPGLFV